MMTIIANIVLVAVTVLDLCIMLCLDSKMLRQSDFKSSRFYKQLIESDEFTSPKRLLAFAALIGACSTMARMSWIVVLILAAVILAQAIILGHKIIKDEQNKSDKRSKRLYFATIVISLLLIGLAAYFGNRNSMVEASQAAALAALLLLSASPLVIMLVNWLLHPLKHHNDK